MPWDYGEGLYGLSRCYICLVLITVENVCWLCANMLCLKYWIMYNMIHMLKIHDTCISCILKWISWNVPCLMYGWITYLKYHLLTAEMYVICSYVCKLGKLFLSMTYVSVKLNIWVYWNICHIWVIK